MSKSDTEINGYSLSRNWFDFCFDNPELISPNHTAIYFFAIEHCNRLGWKKKFGFPSQMTMEALGIKKHSTYIRYFNDLVDWGFFELIQKSQNQYSSNIISLVSAMPKNGKAMGKAIANHTAKQTEKQSETIRQTKRSINKPINNKTIKPKTTKQRSDVKSPLHKLFIESFSFHYEKYCGTKFSWSNGKHHTGIKNCIKEVKEAYRTSEHQKLDNPTDKQMVDGFEMILRLASKDKFLLQNYEPSIIASKFNNIKNLKNNGREQKLNNQYHEILSKFASDQTD